MQESRIKKLGIGVSEKERCRGAWSEARGSFQSWLCEDGAFDGVFSLEAWHGNTTIATERHHKLTQPPTSFGGATVGRM
jgi:hypothetical protein